MELTELARITTFVITFEYFTKGFKTFNPADVQIHGIALIEPWLE